MEKTSIPYDIYENSAEMVIVMPLWWVKKDSIECILDQSDLIIKWKREKPNLKESLKPTKEECFWWDFETIINLPMHVYFDKIYVKFLSENILTITVPKVIIPKKLKLDIRYL